MPSHLNPPYGGELRSLLVDEERRAELVGQMDSMPSLALSPDQLCDLELLLNGGFSPLGGYLGRSDFERVCKEMRLSDGTLWPWPLALPVPESIASGLREGEPLSLVDLEGVTRAVLRVAEIWPADPEGMALSCCGSDDPDHPGVARIRGCARSHWAGGRVEGLSLPAHYDFRPLRLTPEEARTQFEKRGFRKVVAFQTPELIHRPEQELSFRVSRQAGANLLIQAEVGPSSPEDLEHYSRVRCVQALLSHYPRDTAVLGLLELTPRHGGARELLLRAIVARNFGCTHLLAHPGAAGDEWMDPGRDLAEARRLAGEVGVDILGFETLSYVEDQDAYLPADQVPRGAKVQTLTPAQLHRRLGEGRRIPEWASFPEVIEELARTVRPRNRQGFTLFFSGLSGAGKSTVANVIRVKLMEMGTRPVTLLDGDIVRRHLSSELGFSREHRDINIRRIGFVASEITKNGGIAICAPIAPYHSVRREVRAMVEKGGGFVLVHVATPLEVCERRDRKGMYRKARAGLIKKFTGVSDPYEVPGDAEVIVDTTEVTPDEAAQQVLLYLEKAGYIG